MPLFHASSISARISSTSRTVSASRDNVRLCNPYLLNGTIIGLLAGGAVHSASITNRLNLRGASSGGNSDHIGAAMRLVQRISGLSDFIWQLFYSFKFFNIYK